MAGGLARRAAIIESFNKTKAPLLVIDTGNACAPRCNRNKPETDLLFSAMAKMGYAAMAPGKNDFFCKYSPLHQSHPLIPIIASNLINKRDLSPIQPYLIKKTGSIRIGIVSILPEDLIKTSDASPLKNEFTILSPESTLAGLIPEIRDQSDVIILLSSCKKHTTQKILDEIPDINVAIISETLPDPGCDADDGQYPENTNGSTLFSLPGDKGQHLGHIRLKLTKNNSISQIRYNSIPLPGSLEKEPAIAEMIDAYYHSSKLRKQKQTLQKYGREIEELQKLSPEEYFEMLNQQNRKNRRTTH